MRSASDKLRRALLVTTTSIFAIGAALVASEGTLRVFGERPVIWSEWVLLRDGWLDRDVIFSPPDLRSSAHHAVEPRLPVLATLGDSFTKGYPVAQEGAYPVQLGTLLRAGGSPASIIDLGVGDTGSDQQLRLFEREILPRLTPDVVVWQLYPNDEWDNQVKATYTIVDGALVPLDATRNWMYRRQLFYRAFPFKEWLRESSWLFRQALKAAEHWQQSAVPSEYAAKPWLWGAEKIRLAVARMNELARTRGFRLYVVVVAPQAVYFKSSERNKDIENFGHGYERLYDLVRSEPGFIDARFHDFDEHGPAEAIFVDGSRDGLGPGGRHFNERGYRMLAELVASRLLADGALTAARASRP